MVVGPSLGFFPHLRNLFSADLVLSLTSANGLSPLVPLVLLTSNIIRVGYWLHSRFEPALLAQSVLMVAVQTVLIFKAVRVRRCSQRSARAGGSMEGPSSMNVAPTAASSSQASLYFPPNFFAHFWEWEAEQPYVAFVAVFSAAVALFSSTTLGSPMAQEFLGWTALSIEATLGLPQIFANINNRSVKGLSVFLIMTWTLGDSTKMAL